MRALFSLVLLVGSLLFFVPQTALADAQTGTCTDGTRSQAQVGPFMQNICGECYDQGNCSLRDAETVFANISQFILGIIGSLVLFMYIVGGIFMMMGGYKPDYYEKGKKYLKGSTLGLVIVLFAYTIVVSLKSALQTGEIQNYVICDGTAATEAGPACAPNSQCQQGVCVPKCLTQGDSTTQYSCVPASLATVPPYTGCSSGVSSCTTSGDQCCFTKSTTTK